MNARESIDSAYSTATKSRHQHADHQSCSVPNLPCGLLAILHTISNVCRAGHPEFDFATSRTSFRGNSWLQTLHPHVGIGVEPDAFDVQLCPSVCRAYRGAAGSTFPNKYRIANLEYKHASQQACAASIVRDEDFQIIQWTKEQYWHALLSLLKKCIASQVAILWLSLPFDTFTLIFHYSCQLMPYISTTLPEETPAPKSHLAHMPLHTYAYTCGCRRHVQGRECSCFLNELLSINNPTAFSASQANCLPFNMDHAYPRPSSSQPQGATNAYVPNLYSSCRRHDRKYRSRFDCPDHVYRRQRSSYENYWEVQRLREFEHRRRFGREWSGFGSRG